MNQKTIDMTDKIKTAIYFLLSFLGTALSLNADQNGTKESPIDSTIESAFDYREFVFQEGFALSPNGKWIAYSVRQKPPEGSSNKLHTIQGTPIYSVGSRIYISDRDGKAKQLDINGNSWRPVWSPNSSQIAFYSDAKGQPQLWIFDVSTSSFHSIGKLPIKASVFPLDYPQWDKEGKIIYVPVADIHPQTSDRNVSEILSKELPLQDNGAAKAKIYLSDINANNNTIIQSEPDLESIVAKEYQTSIAAIDVKTGVESIIVPYTELPAPAFFQLSPSGKWLSYISPKMTKDISHAYFDLTVSHVDSKELIPIASKLMTDPGLGVAIYQWHPFKDWIVYVQEKKLYLVEFDEKGPKTPRVIHHDLVDLISTPLLFSKDGTKIIVGAKPSVEKEGIPQSLYIVALEQDQLLEISLEPRWNFIKALKANAKQIWEPKKDSISLFLQEIANEQTAVVRFSFNEKEKPREDVLWKGLAQINATASQGNEDELYAIYQDMTSSPNIYRFNSNFSNRQRITLIEPRFNELTVPSVVTYKTRVPLYDGKLSTVHTTVLLPKKNEGNAKPAAIVLIYPGSDFSSFARQFMGGSNGVIPSSLFLERGYALILPEIPISPEGHPGNPLQDMTDALLPQIYHAVDKGLVDVNKLGITGLSYGSYGTAGIIAKTNLFRVAVAISGMYDLAGRYGEYTDEEKDFIQLWTEHGQGRMGSPPWSNLFRYIQNSPYYLADNIHTPLLLIHGEQDYAGASKESMKLFTALKRLHRPAELALYPKEGHVLVEWNKSNAIDATKRVLNFFDCHLKSSSCSTSPN